MKTVGLAMNMEKNNVPDLVKEIANWLELNGCRVVLWDDASGVCEDKAPEEWTSGIECLIVLGGDGTLLNSARQVAAGQIPILGINVGHLGFLTEIDPPDLIPELENLIQGKFTIDERMMLEAQVFRNGAPIKKAVCLNDAVITKGAFARLITMEVYVNGEYVDVYPADGMIVASPTGSTAYSLSAGGPLVLPDLELILVTPICPHSLWVRPLVIGATSLVEVVLISGPGDVMLTMDGQYGLQLERGDSVVIKKWAHGAKFIRLKNRNFFYLLRQKLGRSDFGNGA